MGRLSDYVTAHPEVLHPLKGLIRNELTRNKGELLGQLRQAQNVLGHQSENRLLDALRRVREEAAHCETYAWPQAKADSLDGDDVLPSVYPEGATPGKNVDALTFWPEACILSEFKFGILADPCNLFENRSHFAKRIESKFQHTADRLSTDGERFLPLRFILVPTELLPVCERAFRRLCNSEKGARIDRSAYILCTPVTSLDRFREALQA